MGQIIRIAVRNLWQHKTKSLILGIFICVGVAIVLCGNGFLESTQRGMERDFRANYTGDIFIEEKMEDGVVLDITGANSMGSAMGESISTPALMNIDKIDSIIKSTDGIKAETKFITSKGILSTEKVGDDFEPADDVRNEIPYFLIFSGETDSYYKMFDKMHITSGALPSDSADEDLVDKVLVEGMGTGNGFIIREATVCGFYDQPDVNTAMAAIAYISPRLARSFAGLTYASSYAEELPSTVDTSLSSQSEDDLFGSGDDMLSSDGSDSDVLASSSTDFNNILGDTSMRDKLNQGDDGSYHFIVLKITHSGQADKIISSLNKQFDSQGLTCKAVNWKSAASSYVKAVEGIGGIFTALVVILAIVVFIIIMNTLIVSVIERTAEIGTMRALGADKLFVRKLFFTESISISLIASIAGVILAFIAMAIVNACHFTVTGDIAKIILGGGSISLLPTVKSVVTTVLLVMLGSVLANIYPVRAALRITPLQALSQDGE